MSGLASGGPLATTIPPGATNPRARGSVRSRAPAQRIATASNALRNSFASSARALTTRAPVRPSSRTAAERNDARRRRLSSKVNSISGLTILIGIPGRPAPAPKSRRDRTSGERTRKNSRLSSRRFSTIQSDSVELTSRVASPHFLSNSRYLLNRPASGLESGRPRMLRTPSSSPTGRRLPCRSTRRR
jgi:hypothetical protein